MSHCTLDPSFPLFFTHHLWKKITPIYKFICQQPFITELAAGKLDRNRFIFYLQQDALYLVDFARALAHTAAKLHAVNHVENFLSFAQEALIAERALHTQYFKLFEVEPNTYPQPACFHYTNYLLATVSLRSVEEAVTALLPCFWIYAEIGQYIATHSVAGNIYQDWIAMYSSEDFYKAVLKIRDIVDTLAAQSHPQTHYLMEQAFVRSSRLESFFWDSTYKLEKWSF